MVRLRSTFNTVAENYATINRLQQPVTCCGSVTMKKATFCLPDTFTHVSNVRFKGATIFCRSPKCRTAKCRNSSWRLENVEALSNLCNMTWPNLLGYHLTHSGRNLTPAGAVRRGHVNSTVYSFRHFVFRNFLLRPKIVAPASSNDKTKFGDGLLPAFEVK
jgi:hypothetical protein